MIPEKVQHYVSELTRTHSSEAWYALVEMGPAALPHVVQAFEAASDRSVAVDLIRVMNEYRTLAALPFLANLLRAGDPDIWKTALDGIVTVGGSSAAERLREIRETLSPEKQQWIDEALEQIPTGDG